MERVGAEERAAAASQSQCPARIVPFSRRSIFTIDYRAVPSGAGAPGSARRTRRHGYRGLRNGRGRTVAPLAAPAPSPSHGRMNAMRCE